MRLYVLENVVQLLRTFCSMSIYRELSSYMQIQMMTRTGSGQIAIGGIYVQWDDVKKICSMQLMAKLTKGQLSLSQKYIQTHFHLHTEGLMDLEKKLHLGRQKVAIQSQSLRYVRVANAICVISFPCRQWFQFEYFVRLDKGHSQRLASKVKLYLRI